MPNKRADALFSLIRPIIFFAAVTAVLVMSDLIVMVSVIAFLGCPVPGLPIGLFECRNHVLLVGHVVLLKEPDLFAHRCFPFLRRIELRGSTLV